MYIPKAFAETDQAKLVEFIQANSFGILFSQHQGQASATHLPFLLETEGEKLVLWGHFARANPHWREIEGEALVVFPGPHAYISPAWYESPNVVPTWNYVAVHAYGTLTLIQETERLLEMVHQLVNYYESARPDPWQFEPSLDFNQKLVSGIVGFKIELTRLEGKWKLSQNHPEERQQKVIKALQQSQDQNEQAVAQLMVENLAIRQEVI